jgi:hypothetical protein
METYNTGSVIEMSYGSVAFTTTHILNAQDPPYMNMTVTHVAEDGSIIYNTPLETSNPLNFFFSPSSDLIQTGDGGLLVSCFISNYTTYIYQPALFKISAYGNLEWAKTFPVNSDSGISDPLLKTSLVKVEEDQQIESYLLAFAGNSDNDGLLNIMILNVNLAGEVVWGREYIDEEVKNNGSLISELPMDIGYSPDGDFYLISGRRDDASGIVGTSTLSLLSINSSGDLVTGYRTVPLPGNVFESSLAYDSENGVFALTYTQFNASLINNGCASSLIGLLTVDNDLEIQSSHYYYTENTSEHFGKSISVDQNSNYVIGCFVYPSDCEDIGISTAVNGAMLKVNPNGEPISFSRYNTSDLATLHQRGSCIARDYETNEDEYVMLTQRSNDMRLIRTDNSGDACGRVSYDVAHGTLNPGFLVYNFIYNTIDGVENLQLTQLESGFEICSCTGESAESYCDPFTFIDESHLQNSLSVFPNPISSTNPIIQLQGNFGSQNEIHLFNSLGQEVFTTTFRFQTNPSIRLTPNLTAGIYLLEITNTETSETSNTKMIVR